jgi:AAA family ATP:ADP antiporter
MTFTFGESDHRGKAWGAGFILMLMMAGHTALETARDSLFLSRLPVSQLPFTYAAIAVAALGAAEINARLRTRFDHRQLFSLTLLLGAVGCLGFVRLFQLELSWAPHAFYVWIAVIATLATAQFWLLAAEYFTVLQAKKAYGVISAGGLVGAMLGGGLARLTAEHLGDLALLGLGAFLFVATAFVPKVLAAFREDGGHGQWSTPTFAPSEAGRSGATRDPRTHSYLRRVLILTLLATVAATVVDYLFKAEVARRIAPNELGNFFGTFNMGLSFTALLLQLFIAPQLMTRNGVGRSLLITPGTLSLAAVLALLSPAFMAIVLLRGLDGALRYSVHRSSVEVLFLPLSTQTRARWKMVVDVLGQRGGQALAAIAILATVQLEISPKHMLMGALVLCVGWLVLAATIESHYVSLFRAKIKAGAIDTRADVPELDLRSMESLVAALGSENDDEVLAAIDLLGDYDRVRAIPALLLYHPSRIVVLRTLEVFARAKRTDFTGAARRLLERDDDELRAAAMLALAGQMPEAELRRELSQPLASATRAAVLVAIITRELDRDGTCARAIEVACEPSSDPTTRLAFAHALRLQGGPSCVTYLPRLALEASLELELEVAEGMLATPHESFVPMLIRMLDSRAARNTARDALAAIGEPALIALQRAAEDIALPRRLRAHLPRSITRFGTEQAADILLDRLEHEEDGWIRFKIIRGLGFVREHLHKHSRMQQVLKHARVNLVQALHFMRLRLGIERDRAARTTLQTKGGDLLVAVLRDKEQRAVDRAVRRLGLSHAANVIHNIRQALSTRDSRLRADSIELLMHGAPHDLAAALTAFLDNQRDEVRVDRAAQALNEPFTAYGYEDRIVHMLSERSSAVRALAAYHMNELGLRATPSQVPPPLPQHASALSRDVLSRLDELRTHIELREDLVPALGRRAT